MNIWLYVWTIVFKVEYQLLGLIYNHPSPRKSKISSETNMFHNLHWDRGRFSIKMFDFSNFESSERPIFMFDKKPSSDLWFLTLSRFLPNHQNLGISKIQKFQKLQSLTHIKALEIWALKWGFFRLKWKLSPSTDTLNSPKIVLELDF